MNFLYITKWMNPEDNDFEIVERKGLGHPDTLADGLAESISKDYSHYCLNNFGYILHHNVDKLYVGGGLFYRDFGVCEMKKPIRVVVNGRMSNSVGGKTFDIAEIQRSATLKYLRWVLPNLGFDGVVVDTNATQHTLRPFWFAPRDINDVPDAFEPKANDTSICVAHWPRTVCEQLAYELEQSLWTGSINNLIPRYSDVGQDVKVMIVRQNNKIDVVACVPFISTKTPSFDAYQKRVEDVRKEFCLLAQQLTDGTSYKTNVQINTSRLYLLGTGSCVECGEEGLVGRGNQSGGVISIFRAHSMEAPSGKNPAYHTGRVLGFLTFRLAKALYDKLNVRCSVMAITKNGHSLIPPFLLAVGLERTVDEKKLCAIIEEDFLEVDYIHEILTQRMTI